MASLSIDDRHDKHGDARAEAKARHLDIAKVQFSELQYWLGFLDDLLSCDIRVWNARLVEWFVREVVVSTVLLRWNCSLDVISRQHSNSDHDAKVSMEEYKARAEIRVSIIFLTQLFGMVEYSPLVRMVGAAVLHHKYPQAWCNTDGTIRFDEEDGSFFVVTPAINSMISKSINESSAANGEEADAGAGGGTNAEDIGEGTNELTENVVDNSLGNEEDKQTLTSNHHRASLLNMLSGVDTYSSDETILSSMLLATVLENDAIDSHALEIFGILPSPTINDEGDSPFELAIAKYLSQDWPDIDSSSYLTLACTIECSSTLGFMLLERLITHTWTEAGQVLEAVPFVHQYNNSKYIQALERCLSHFATQVKAHLDDASIRDVCSDLIKQHYSVETNDTLPDSPRSDQSSKLVCSLQSHYPSNFIDDNAGALAGEIVYGGAHDPSAATTSAGDLVLFDHDTENIKLALQATLHLRSLLGCIQDLQSRITQPHTHTNSRWKGEGDALSFHTTEEADDILLSISGIQTTPLPEVGTNIDLRGRKLFLCSLPRRFGSNKHVDIIIDINGTRIVVTEKADLVLVVDPSELYVAKAKKDGSRRAQVLAIVPLQTIVACAAEGQILHIVCPTEESQSNILKDGRLSLKFRRSGSTCQSVKECLDKHCDAYQKKIMMDLTDMLDQCVMGDKSSSQSNDNEVEESWDDFQQA